jgi:signal transduction histidine kinase
MNRPGGGEVRRARVLAVDDDEHNLLVTQVLLEQEHDVRTARCGIEALALLELAPADVVLADQRMPALSGVELLERVRQRWPDTVRMIVTAYADVRDILDAIHRGHVHRYVLKPWRPEEMRLAVQQAAELAHEHRERTRLAGELERTATELRARNAELERALERAVVAERMALVGRFAAETAHELGNLAQIVSGISDVLVLRSARSDGGAPDGLRTAADRLVEVTGVLRDLAGGARSTECLRVPEDVAALVRQTVELLRHHPAAAEREIVVAAPPSLVWPVDRRLLRHLLLNLLRNACEAARHRVEVAVRTEPNLLRLVVEDDGPGVPVEMRGRIFEPFFTTKSTGMGLGLSVCQRAARDHGGALLLEEGAAGGAKFVVEIPLALRRDAAVHVGLAADGTGLQV